MVFDVTEADFEQRVLERSRSVPVVVDFWAEWCGPCRALGPALEKAAAAREGRVELAKLDVDSNQRLAASFRVQGIPAVKAFKDGRVVEEFTGALPPQQVEAFFDKLVPSQAEIAAEAALAGGDEDALRRALADDPGNAQVVSALGRILLGRGERDEALELLERVPGDFVAQGLAARAQLDGDIEPVFEAWDACEYEHALEGLQEAMTAAADADERDRIRRVMVAIFTELGPEHPLAREHRRRLSAALF